MSLVKKGLFMVGASVMATLAMVGYALPPETISSAVQAQQGAEQASSQASQKEEQDSAKKRRGVQAPSTSGVLGGSQSPDADMSAGAHASMPPNVTK